MKVKNVLWALSLTVVCATTQIACNSKPSEKAEDVRDEKEDVIEAQREGDSSEVMSEQAELDSARGDYREAVQDSLKRANN